ncbi:MAG: DNA-binding response regulator, partial [Chitinophagaceae bacterium]
MAIKVSIVEDLPEVREGLARLINSDDELELLQDFENAESAMR